MIIIREEDCGTDRGMTVSTIQEGNEVIVPLGDRLVGRTAFRAVKHPETGEVIVQRNELITEDISAEILEAGIESVTIRSVFTCNTQHGACNKCYGRNMATGDQVDVGEAVGTLQLNPSVSQVLS